MVNPSSEECSFHFFTRKLHFWFQDNLHDLHWWTNMVDIDLRLIRFRRWYKICHTYVHQAAIGGGTTCPYEQLTPYLPYCHLQEEVYLSYVYSYGQQWTNLQQLSQCEIAARFLFLAQCLIYKTPIAKLNNKKPIILSLSLTEITKCKAGAIILNQTQMQHCHNSHKMQHFFQLPWEQPLGNLDHSKIVFNGFLHLGSCIPQDKILLQF